MCVVSVGRCVCIGCNYVCATVLYYGLGGWVVMYVGGGVRLCASLWVGCVVSVWVYRSVGGVCVVRVVVLLCGVCGVSWWVVCRVCSLLRGLGG